MLPSFSTFSPIYKPDEQDPITVIAYLGEVNPSQAWRYWTRYKSIDRALEMIEKQKRFGKNVCIGLLVFSFIVGIALVYRIFSFQINSFELLVLRSEYAG